MSSSRGADPALRERVRALPGSLTYLDLIRRNRLDSALLVAVMVALAALIGIALAALGSTGGGDLGALTPSLATGALVGLGVALIVSIWSWYGGARAILSLSGAREVAKADDPELYNVVDEIRIAAGLPMPRVHLIDDSALNAFATGRDPAHAAVAITRGLRERLTRDELQAVLAHEMAHVRHLDIRFAMLMATLAGVIALVSDGALRSMRHARLRRGGGGRGGGGAGGAIIAIVALVFLVLAPFVAWLVQMAYSRRREYLADAGAVELTRNPEALASALAKLADDTEPLVDGANRGTAHLYIVHPLRKASETRKERSSWFSSHPPIRERIARLLALAR